MCCNAMSERGVEGWGGAEGIGGLSSHPWGSRNTSSRFMLGDQETSAGQMGHLARMQYFSYMILWTCKLNLDFVGKGQHQSSLLE